MAPIKSSLARTVSRLLGVSKDTDLSLRGDVQNTRFKFIPVSATGGTTSEPGNGYKYHFFTSSDDFVVTGAGDIDYLVVGGGGGGGNSSGNTPGAGGGGAGGFRELIGQPITPGTYPVVIGDGGSAGTADGPYTNPPSPATNGSPSSFNGLVSAGGGHGGMHPQAAPGQAESGGSGGGSSGPYGAGAGNTPPTSPPQGHPGGNHNSSAGGGGGGAAEGGEDAPSSTVGGAGGDGLAAFSGDGGIPSSYGEAGPTPGRSSMPTSGPSSSSGIIVTGSS